MIQRISRRDGVRRQLLLASIVVVLAWASRFALADLVDWGVDEGSTLWLGRQIASGHPSWLGLMSSRGVRNLAGVPLVAAFLSPLADLVTISHALDILQVAALLALAYALRTRGAALIDALVILLFCPAMILVAGSLWNQYVFVIAAVVMIAATLWNSHGASPTAVTGLPLAIAVFLPTLHLSGFADLAAFAVAWHVAADHDPRFAHSARVLTLAPALLVSATYLPWLIEPSTPAIISGAAIAIVSGAIASFRIRRLSSAMAAPFNRLLDGRAGAWMIAAVVAFAGVFVSIHAIVGSVVHRTMFLERPAMMLLLVSEFAPLLIALPGIEQIVHDCRAGATGCEVLRNRFMSYGAAAFVVLFLAVAMPLRLALAPTALLPWGRTDLWIPELPAALTLLIVVKRPFGPAASVIPTLSAAAALIGALWLGALDWSNTRQAIYPRLVRASDIRAAVDFIAAQSGTEKSVSVGYDLDQGIEWVTGPRWCQLASWYSVGRPYDWLLATRHALRNRYEGTCERRVNDADWEIGYVNDQTTEMNPRFGQIEVRRRRP